MTNDNKHDRGYPDFHQHLDTLAQRGLLQVIDRPIDKDSELHPLVRWQFVGGLAEADRKAFLFTNIVNAQGRRYTMPVVVGAMAANRQIYSVGMGCSVEEIEAKWRHALAHPIAPKLVAVAECQELVHEGAALQGEGNGLDRLPIPVSTPGFDSAPTLTATNVITVDPTTGVQNMGTYRCQLKAPNGNNTHKNAEGNRYGFQLGRMMRIEQMFIQYFLHFFSAKECSYKITWFYIQKSYKHQYNI